MYQKAAHYAPYSFFYINMNSKDINKMFYINFQHVFSIDEGDD